MFCLFLQSPELLQLRANIEEVTKQQAVTSQQLAALQIEKEKVEVQLKKLTTENASLKQQLSSSSGDIDMLQVCFQLGQSND